MECLEEVLVVEEDVAICHWHQGLAMGQLKICTSAFVASELIGAHISASVLVLKDTVDIASAVGGKGSCGVSSRSSRGGQSWNLVPSPTWKGIPNHKEKMLASGQI